MEAMQPGGQVLGDGQGQVGGPGVQAVHYGQLHHLDVMIVRLPWGKEGERPGYSLGELNCTFLYI